MGLSEREGGRKGREGKEAGRYCVSCSGLREYSPHPYYLGVCIEHLRVVVLDQLRGRSGKESIGEFVLSN